MHDLGAIRYKLHAAVNINNKESVVCTKLSVYLHNHEILVRTNSTAASHGRQSVVAVHIFFFFCFLSLYTVLCRKN